MTGLIILAAGESSRLGKPKQNLLYKGKTLLQHAIATATRSVCLPIVVVLGAHHNLILPTLKKELVKIIYNADWKDGMASSIKTGLNALKNVIDADSVIIMLCDQPFVDTILLNKLIINYHTSNKGIIACSYNDTAGVPVLFSQAYFADLLSLTGNEGAKRLLSLNLSDMATIPFPQGNTDIDTLEDYESLIY